MKSMRYVGAILMLLFSLVVKAQDIRTLFVAMPDSVCPLLTAVNRADFGDFLDSGMKAVVKNRLGKTSEMKVMARDYLMLQLTSADDWEMKLLPLNDSVSVVCVVKSFHSTAHDSSIEFYDTDWKKLNKSRFIDLPGDSAFFRTDLTTEQQDSLSALKNSIGMTLVSMKLSPDNRQLKMRCTSAEYMGKDERKSFSRFVDKDVVYCWQDGKFVSVATPKSVQQTEK